MAVPSGRIGTGLKSPPQTFLLRGGGASTLSFFGSILTVYYVLAAAVGGCPSHSSDAVGPVGSGREPVMD